MKLRKKVYCIAIDKSKVLIVQHNEYKENEWSFPGGGIDEGETEEETALREFKEELNGEFGIIMRDDEPFVYYYPQGYMEKFKPDHDGQSVIVFFGKCSGDLVKRDEEIREFRWVEFEDLKNYLIFPNQFEEMAKRIRKSGLI